MVAAELPPEAAYIPGFVADHRKVFWDLVEEFYANTPDVVYYGGPRLVSFSFRTDELTEASRNFCDGDRSALRKRLWLPHTAMLGGMVFAHTGVMPDAVAYNLYRDGSDFLMPHSDSDNQFGPSVDDVVIATVSFGQPRLLTLDPIDEADPRRISFELTPGSLFTMRGALQRKWLHGIGKDASPGPRLSLTFLCYQRDPVEKHSWTLVRMPDMKAVQLNPGESDKEFRHRIVTQYQGLPTRQVFIGSLEETFDKWTELERTESEAKYTMSRGGHTTYASRVDALGEHPSLYDRLPDDDPLRSSFRSYNASSLPHPSDVDLKHLPTDFLEEMVSLGQQELEHRQGQN